ncbi:MAG: hypothetical protein ACI81O_002556, partial [Cyclobacteriaceae bacterium]
RQYLFSRAQTKIDGVITTVAASEPVRGAY